jgi:hypothetical protein
VVNPSVRQATVFATCTDIKRAHAGAGHQLEPRHSCAERAESSEFDINLPWENFAQKRSTIRRAPKIDRLQFGLRHAIAGERAAPLFDKGQDHITVRTGAGVDAVKYLRYSVYTLFGDDRVSRPGGAASISSSRREFEADKPAAENPVQSNSNPSL